MNRPSGFTLVELMIVIAIIAFLSMVTIPSLMKFLAKSKRSEAYLYLRTLAQAEKSYYIEHGSYTKKLSGPDSLGWKPEGSFFYTYGFPEGGEGKSHFVGQLKTPASALSGAAISRDGFVIYAAGNIYGGEIDIVSIDHHGVIKIVNDALA